MKKNVRKFFKSLGPGFITGASDDDPSGIATYSQTGAQFGFKQLWVALFTFPFMVVIQEMCGRIGLVTGTGLSGVIRKHYSKKALYFTISLLLIANTINIGADLGAMAAALELLIPVPFTILLLGVTAFTLILEIFVSYHVYVRILKYLALSLLAYVVIVFLIKIDWRSVAYHTFVPHLSLQKEYILNIVALLGTTISPYLFFWQANEEVEEEIEEGKLKTSGRGIPKITNLDIKNMRRDTWVGMLFSNLITFFIIVTAAVTLGAQGITNIETATDAAQALRPFGMAAFLLFTVGIVGTGLLTVPVLAGSASYAISEAFKWKTGLYRKFSQAHGFYGIITIATIVGLLVNFTHIPPFKMLYYTAMVNGILAVPLLIVILRIANNKKIMGERVNSRASNVLGWIITGVMMLAGGTLFYTLF
jgi:NRAMP (natural resistance-associated macrophage protein)-like metal ion transporter